MRRLVEEVGTTCHRGSLVTELTYETGTVEINLIK
jgi:hypothetical protein